MFNPDQPRDDHGRWGGGASGDAKETVSAALDAHTSAISATAASGHAFASQAREMAAKHMASGQQLEAGAGTPDGARAANAEYAAHANLIERAVALEKEANANDRNVHDLGRARAALDRGEVERAANILDDVSSGDSVEHDAFQEDYLKTTATGHERNSSNLFVNSHYGRDMTLSDTLHHAHEDDGPRVTETGHGRFLVMDSSDRQRASVGNRQKAEKLAARVAYQDKQNAKRDPNRRA